jgi:hypothetical protein
MADSNTPRDRSGPNDPSMKEKAEGSRDNVNIEAIDNDNSQESGISNRPIEEEQREQQNLPPRGRNKEGGHA